MCSAQSTKTVNMMVMAGWSISEDPAPMLWVTGNAKEATKFAKSRLMPMLEECAPVVDKIPDGRYDKTNTAIYFPGSPFFITGADSPLSLQSHPFKAIFLDEVRSWREGALEMVSKRVRAFPHFYKKIIVSTPDMADDPLHRAYLDGSQTQWHFLCPECGEDHLFGWGRSDERGGLKWDTNEKTFDKGDYVWDNLFDTIRYECPHCDAQWKETTANRKMISRSGFWKDYNPNAASNVRSYCWNALLPWWPSWEMQVKEFLLATKALKVGAWKPLKDHLNETRGEIWTDERRWRNDERAIEDRVGDYEIGDFMAVEKFADINFPRKIKEWEEVRRIMSVDVQGKGGRHFYLVIRSWTMDGRSRLLHHEKVFTYDDIRSLAKEWMVHPNYVCLDAAHFSGEIYQEIMKTGNKWKAFRGDKREHFTVTDAMGNRVQRIWQKSLADPGIGTKWAQRVANIPIYLFSKPSTIDRLDMFLHGLVPGWEINNLATEDYRSQVMAYYRHEFHDTHGNRKVEWRSKREDHYADAERINLTCAAIEGFLQF